MNEQNKQTNKTKQTKQNKKGYIISLGKLEEIELTKRCSLKLILLILDQNCVSNPTAQQNMDSDTAQFGQALYLHLRVLSECLILIGSAMFDATFNLVTRVGLPSYLER